MGWISSLFRKEKEIETVYVELSKLSQWFDERTEPLLENIKDDIQAKLREIKVSIERARECSASLEAARLSNDKIPERAIQIMEGNRDAYIKSVSLFLDQIKTPTAVNMGHITEYLSRFEDNLNYFTKTSSRSYYVLQEFFKDESGSIAQYIKRIDAISRSLLDNDYKKVNSVSEKISEVQDFLEMRKKASDLIEEEKTNYSSINAMKRDTEDKIEKLHQSRDFRDLQEIDAEKKKVEKELKTNEMDLISLFSPIEKSMKKYSKIAFDGDDILKAYLESFIKALMRDENLLIVDVLGRMRDSVVQDQLELKDKKKERTLEALNLITRERLRQYSQKHYELVDSLGKLKRRENINTASQKLNELNYKLTHLNSQLERSHNTIEKLKKQMDKTDLSQTLSGIEDEVNDLLSLKLKIRWHNENAQKPA
ncbi:MAG: hypothetical protein KKE20_05760 [Nanoarchaeota archaeon]|nr:hypothetical protein [Nanoarchaeota archaeon]